MAQLHTDVYQDPTSGALFLQNGDSYIDYSPGATGWANINSGKTTIHQLDPGYKVGSYAAAGPNTAKTATPSTTTSQPDMNTFYVDQKTGQQLSKDQLVAGQTYIESGSGKQYVAPTTAAGTSTNTSVTTPSNVITDPLTGKQYSNDTGTYTPYTPPAQTGTNQAATTTPNTTGAPTTQGTAQDGQSTVVPPSVALQPGATGQAVKQLQDYLVSQGLMTPEQVATGYGTYGPQTTAAVTALQQRLGVDNSTGVGYFGPKTMSATQNLSTSQGSKTGASGITTIPDVPAGSTAPDTNTATDAYAGLDPVQKQVKMYTEAYTALGLGDVKTQYEKVLKDQQDLTDKMNDEIAETNDNPWLSEGVRVKTIERIKDRYATKLDTYTHLATLYDSLYKQGQAQVENIVSGAQADMKAANDLAQKQLDAATALAKDNQVVEVNGRELLVNKSTGKTVADLGPVTQKPKTTTTPKLTAAERAANELQEYASAFVAGAKLADGTAVIDSHGFVTPVAWKQAIAEYGGSRADFIKEFGYLLYSDKNGVSPSYGLTPTEQKLVTGSL